MAQIIYLKQKKSLPRQNLTSQQFFYPTPTGTLYKLTWEFDFLFHTSYNKGSYLVSNFPAH